MTGVMEKAFEAASKLPEVDQNALARWVLDEIEADRKWDQAFSESEDVLEQLALETLAEDEQGKTADLETDKL